MTRPATRRMSPDYWDCSQGPLPQEVQDARADLIRARHAWQTEVDRTWIWGTLAIIAVLAVSTVIMVALGYGPR